MECRSTVMDVLSVHPGFFVTDRVRRREGGKKRVAVGSSGEAN